MMLLLSLNAASQVTVEQNVDSVGILIGEQAHLQLTVTMPAGSTIQWPALKERQMVVPGVEVVKVADADTLSSSGKELKVCKVYTITSFDEHLYSIPPLPVKVNGKNYQGGVAALKVITVNVDTLHPNQFFPPKDVQDNPFSWAEWRPYFWLSLLMLLIVLVMGYLYIRLRSNKPVITRIRIVKHVPAHQRALNAINKILTLSNENSDKLRLIRHATTQLCKIQFVIKAFLFQLSQVSDFSYCDQSEFP